LHVLLVRLPLSPRCGSVGDVLFRAGLDVVGSVVFSSIGVPLTMLVVVVVVYLFSSCSGLFLHALGVPFFELFWVVSPRLRGSHMVV
jgi:hypothetical protein